jgi:hypothetical protein
MLIMSIISSQDVSAADMQYKGKVSYFEADHGSSLINAAKPAQLPAHYCACRWRESALCRNLKIDSSDLRETLYRSYRVEVMNPKNGRKRLVVPADTGPARRTGRSLDLDKGTMDALGLETDDQALFKLVRRES